MTPPTTTTSAAAGHTAARLGHVIRYIAADPSRPVAVLSGLNQPAAPALDTATAARLLGQSPGPIQLWQQMGPTVHRIGNTIKVRSHGTALVGRQQLDDDGHPTYTVVVNKRPDDEASRR